MDLGQRGQSQWVVLGLLVGATAVYFAVVMFVGLAYFYEDRGANRHFLFQLFVWVVPAVLCGLTQHYFSLRAGVSPPRLWTQVAVAVVVAPLTGVLLVWFAFLALANLAA